MTGTAGRRGRVLPAGTVAPARQRNVRLRTGDLALGGAVPVAAVRLARVVLGERFPAGGADREHAGVLMALDVLDGMAPRRLLWPALSGPEPSRRPVLAAAHNWRP